MESHQSTQAEHGEMVRGGGRDRRGSWRGHTEAVGSIAVWLVIVAGLLAIAGCSSVKRIGKVSMTPILHVTVGTTIDVYWPEIEFEDSGQRSAISHQPEKEGPDAERPSP